MNYFPVYSTRKVETVTDFTPPRHLFVQTPDLLIKNRPKVLFYYLEFGAMGGIGSFIHQVSLALKQQGNFEPLVVCSNGTNFFNQIKDSGIRLYGISIPAWIPKQLLKFYMNPHFRIFDLPVLFQLWRILRKEKPDLVHIHIGQLENMLFRMMNYPIIYTFHGYGTLYSLKGITSVPKLYVKRLLRLLFRWFVPNVDSMLFVSKAEQSRMIEERFLPQGFSKGEVLYNGLPIRQFMERAAQTDYRALRKSLEIPENARIVSFINRIDSFKNPLLFVKLAERLAMFPYLMPIHFIIAGNGSMESQLDEAIRQSPFKSLFHILGYRSDVAELLSISDLTVCIPSMEGFGLSVLESIAVGTPCLAFSTGGIPEILAIPEAKQFLISPGDFETLLQKAVDLLKLSERERQLLSESLKKQAMTFDISNFINCLERIYGDILNRYKAKTAARSAV